MGLGAARFVSGQAFRPAVREPSWKRLQPLKLACQRLKPHSLAIIFGAPEGAP